MSKYRAFFVTVAAKCGVPDEVARGILSNLSKRCEEIDYVPESHSSGKIHVHIMLLCHKSLKKENMKRCVQTIVSKFIAEPQCSGRGVDVRVVDDFDSVREYMSKASKLCCKFPKLQEYVRENFSVAKEIIRENAVYRANQLKYAYDNFDTWKSELDWRQPGPELWGQYRCLMAKHSGKRPATYWKLQDTFRDICYRTGYVSSRGMQADCPNWLKPTNSKDNISDSE